MFNDIDSNVEFSKNENYWEYHQNIRQAEIEFFINNNIDNCLDFYDKALNGFSFNYLHDLVNVAQIAFYSNKEYKSYIYKALYFGLESQHLKQIPLFKKSDIIQELEQYENTDEYRDIRKKYIKSIDYGYLEWTYDLIINEMLCRRTDCNNYFEYIQNLLTDLVTQIKMKGYPGNRLIGIDNSIAFSEIGNPELDLKVRVKKYSGILCDHISDSESIILEVNENGNIQTETLMVEDIGIVIKEENGLVIEETESFFVTDSIKNCLTTEDAVLSNTLIPLFLWHHDCAIYYLKDLLINEIGKGNLHPREMAHWADVIYIKKNYDKSIFDVSPFCDNAMGEEGVFRMKWNINRDFGEYSYSEQQTDELRKKYSISPLEVDRQKEYYEKNKGFKLFWGFMDCL